MIIDVYSSVSCIWCKRLMDKLDNAGYKYNVHYLGVDYTKEDLHLMLGDHVNTVPQVIIDEVHIGGHDDTVKHLGLI